MVLSLQAISITTAVQSISQSISNFLVAYVSAATARTTNSVTVTQLGSSYIS